MQIGELARTAGVSTKTIRYYEDIGVLPEPERAPNGYRTYGPRAVETLRFVRDAQSTGLTLTEITAILEMRQRGERTCHHVVGLLERHLAALDEHIAELGRTRKQLAAMTERAKGLDPAACTDSSRCQTISPSSDGSSAAVREHDHVSPSGHRHG